MRWPLHRFTHIFCGNYAAAKALADELVALSEEKGACFGSHRNDATKVVYLALTGRASDAVRMISSGITAYRSTGATNLDAVVLIIFGDEPMRNSADSMMRGAALAKR